MKKSSTRKGLIVGLVTAALTACVAFGCSSPATTADTSSASDTSATAAATASADKATDESADIDAKEASKTELTTEEASETKTDDKAAGTTDKEGEATPDSAVEKEAETEAANAAVSSEADETKDAETATDSEKGVAQEETDFDMSLYPIHVAAVEDGDSVASFHMGLGYTCESCHKGDLAEEIEIAGIDGEPELSSLYYTDTETCLSAGCHNSWEDLAESTADLGDYNPHASIHGTIEYCNECHKAHSPQVDICGECHPNGGQEMLY